ATAGKGTKGEKARSGGLKAGFRGMSSRNFRLAKRRGFTRASKIIAVPVNVGQLARFESGSTVDVEVLVKAGLVGSKRSVVKILGDGELSHPLHVVGAHASGSARKKIEGSGGTVESPPKQTVGNAVDQEKTGDSGSI
ncbi:MAG: uL15 family ribosomal protein, partial [Chloroflexota bacterium]